MTIAAMSKATPDNKMLSIAPSSLLKTRSAEVASENVNPASHEEADKELSAIFGPSEPPQPKGESSAKPANAASNSASDNYSVPSVTSTGVSVSSTNLTSGPDLASESSLTKLFDEITQEPTSNTKDS